MAEIIQFPEEQPDTECVWVDEDGSEWLMYSALYAGSEGPRKGIVFWAKDDQDAEQQIATMRDTLEYGGQVMGIQEY